MKVTEIFLDEHTRGFRKEIFITFSPCHIDFAQRHVTEIYQQGRCSVMRFVRFSPQQLQIGYDKKVFIYNN